MMRRRAEQRAELAEGMWPNRSLLERASPDIVETLACENVEVMEPDGGNNFLQLSGPFNSAHHPRLARLAHHDSLLDSRILDCILVAAALGFAVLSREVDRPLILGEQRDRIHVQGVKVVDAL